MAATTITLDQLPAYFRDMGNQLRAIDYKPALERCRTAMVASTKENFAGGHSPDGTAWPPVKIRARGEARSARPLRDRGLLAASVSARGAQGNIDVVTDASVEWGTNLSYAALHQHGGTIVPTNAKALAIPFTPEAYRAGSPRRFPRPLAVVWPRGRSSGFLVENKAKQTKAGAYRRGAKMLIQYLLLPKAVIPARPFLGWSPKLVETCAAILGDHAEAAAGAA